ncbi:olfactory receptor 1M1-like [Erpetoichthys calabaricus]|uniref:olfactory receptor 1M1-like n=1 Tax=Erpetoichthys calabaricus TaxID=27687 RepID=UPI0022349296|nr:olfactory receptor 1M1-like [Erpetoichthys calabaricus]XP_051783221.1 olfactory receptor 1M1-like [Erpetoichthys calabaricus]XP_051783222.1 olfactory receptor 1M1-like [Erpetoichthys calabaricus]XP_051783223.1 olfactory receptor 1M1-like [Erpetoichthys calabaricus]
MFNSSLFMSEFVLHCEIKPEQRNTTTTLLILIYLVSLIGNLLVILIIMTNRQLQSPMYIYICTLAMIDLANSTILIPKMVSAILSESLVVAYTACLVQMYLILNVELMESLLLTFMALDRYVAVVFPLRYPSIVTSKAVCIGVTLLAISAFLINTSYIIFTNELPFCQTNILPYCFCDYATMVHIACTEDPKYLLLLSTIVITTGVFPLALILFSYVIIALAALRISSVEGKRKVFSTCLTHLLVVGLFYIPLMTSYILPGAGVKLSTEAYNAMVIVGNVVPPMMNPIIYSFRNKEIKSSIYKLLSGKKTSPKINNQ